MVLAESVILESGWKARETVLLEARQCRQRLGGLELEYTVGLKMNPVLQRNSDNLVAEAVRRFEETGLPQRLFKAYWYRAGSWPAARWARN